MFFLKVYLTETNCNKLSSPSIRSIDVSSGRGVFAVFSDVIKIIFSRIKIICYAEFMAEFMVYLLLFAENYLMIVG